MTVKEVAVYLRVKPCTIYNAVKHNEIPVTRVGGMYRFHKALIDKWIRWQSNLSIGYFVVKSKKVKGDIYL